VEPSTLHPGDLCRARCAELPNAATQGDQGGACGAAHASLTPGAARRVLGALRLNMALSLVGDRSGRLHA
jgi:hypothetical protein